MLDVPDGHEALELFPSESDPASLLFEMNDEFARMVYRAAADKHVDDTATARWIAALSATAVVDVDSPVKEQLEALLAEQPVRDAPGAVERCLKLGRLVIDKRPTPH